ncbi:hypothetical protein [Ruegeria sp. HKCCD6428]|uniref:hypothetical protein n=1 Tax=Ruegeria sp. HKCCD6428 TaxID=2683002 RepID=UPI0014909975|nr:hypothetical protein [Ruegeria sp. HKCCD6428]NOC84542.1 hypothetical protein [Ruegeria sp. HKCCD6428]
MIYVHFDATKIPEEKLTALQEAAAALAAIEDEGDRKQYVKDHADLWSALREHLLEMSNKKCWYSEARESVSRFQVDHFRPHGRSKQAPKQFSPGYSWLAFDLLNFRLAGVLCNTQNREHSEETVGKGDWFPLRDPASRATFEDQDCSNETPVLLDPTCPDDPPKLSFRDDGSVEPSPSVEGDDAECVRVAVDLLGLNQSVLNRNRAIVWRSCRRKIVQFNRFAKKPKGARSHEEEETLRELFSELVTMAKHDSEFASVARCCLEANKLGHVVVRSELDPLALADP